MKRSVFLFLFAYIIATPAFAEKVLLVAGPPSHKWGAHEHPDGCRVMAEALNESGLGIEAEVSLGWPEDESVFDEADTIIFYCDGLKNHIALNKTDLLYRLYNDGKGFGFIHFAVEPGDDALEAFLMEAIGGYFEVDWSVNPHWTLENSMLSDHHPACNGVTPLTTHDEWYYHMRFREDGNYEPLLSAHPPESSLGKDGPRTGNPTLRQELAKGIPQHLAWARTGPKGQRGFGFTGAHFLNNFNDDDFRKLVLNAIAWTAGVEVPEEGVVSKMPNIPTYQTIDEAIARGDLQDMVIHLKNDPGLLNAPGKSKMTPLQQAIMRKKTDAALILLEQGADPNAVTGSMQTAAHLAVERNLPEVIRALDPDRIDLGVRDRQGWTALHSAAAKNQLESVQALLDLGSDLNRLSAAGGTPLHEAAASASGEVIELLLQSGVDPSVVSQHGVTALDVAKEFKNAAAIEILQKP